MARGVAVAPAQAGGVAGVILALLRRMMGLQRRLRHWTRADRHICCKHKSHVRFCKLPHLPSERPGLRWTSITPAEHSLQPAHALELQGSIHASLPIYEASDQTTAHLMCLMCDASRLGSWSPHQTPWGFALEEVAGVECVSAGSWGSEHAADGPGDDSCHGDAATKQLCGHCLPQLHCR